MVYTPQQKNMTLAAGVRKWIYPWSKGVKHWRLLLNPVNRDTAITMERFINFSQTMQEVGMDIQLAGKKFLRRY